jgi:DNA-binding CsgD family transcriptional regulator
VLTSAFDLADRCDAGRLVAIAREEIAATGARPRRMRLSGIDSLTASERRVARMAAEGMSNQAIAQALFVTRKTVEKHLGNVYMKLDISSPRSAAHDAGAREVSGITAAPRRNSASLPTQTCLFAGNFWHSWQLVPQISTDPVLCGWIHKVIPILV